MHPVALSMSRGGRGGRRPRFVLPAMGLGLASGLIILAHPLFALGVWSDTQAMVVGLFTAAAVCLLGVATSVRHSRLVRRAALHPVTLAPLCLAGWSLCVAPLADKPWRSVFGTAQNGQGILWYVALSAFTAAALMLRPARRLWLAILMIAAGTSLVAALLGMQGLMWLYPSLVDWGLAPSVRLMQFNEYLAYPAMGLAVAALAWWQEGKRNGASALVLVAVILLLVSRNRTAWLAFPAIFLGCLCLSRWLAKWRYGAVGLGMAAVLVGLLPAVLVFLAQGDEDTLLHSLWSRAVILQTLLPSLLDGVGHFAAGHGWGAVPDELIRYLPASDIRLYDSEWGGLERDIFHSHNAMAEAMLSAGLPAAVLALLLPSAILMGCPRNRIWLAGAFALSWATLDAFWFMIPANLPLIALASAAVIGRPRRYRSGNPSFVAGMAWILALACGAGGAAMAMQSVQESRLIAALASPVATNATLPLDLRDDSYALANILANVATQGPPRPDLLQEAELRAEAHGSLFLSMALVNAISAEAFAPHDFPRAWGSSDALSSSWKRQLRLLLRQAPQRLDVMAPYLNWLLINQRDGELTEMIAYAKTIDDQHPVVLWFEGSMLLQAPDPNLRAAGLRSMRKALQRGLERFMPVDDAVKKALG